MDFVLKIWFYSQHSWAIPYTTATLEIDQATTVQVLITIKIKMYKSNGASKNLYVGEKKKGHFQHSSFLAGGATIASGRLVAQNGVLDVCDTCFNYILYLHAYHWLFLGQYKMKLFSITITIL